MNTPVHRVEGIVAGMAERVVMEELLSSLHTGIAAMQRRMDRLVAIENAALRVASARRDGVVMDRGVLDALDAALEES